MNLSFSEWVIYNTALIRLYERHWAEMSPADRQRVEGQNPIGLKVDEFLAQELEALRKYRKRSSVWGDDPEATKIHHGLRERLCGMGD